MLSLLLYVCVYGILYTVVHPASLDSGQHFTLNPCGDFPDLQTFVFQSNTLRLQQYSDTCLICSNEGYCNAGFNPVTQTGGCSSNNYEESFSQSGSQIKVNGLCMQSMGDNEYAMITMMQCNVGYSNNQYQAWNYNKNGKNYIQSTTNNSLCVTAAFYPPNNCSVKPMQNYDYCNQNLPTHQRVSDLVSKMNLYEKVTNLANSNIGVPRLGVPANKQLECLHGIRTVCGKSYNGNTGCPSSFPHALLLGAAFNRTLWHSIGSAISDEGRALNNQGIGGLYCFSPDINLFRDPRWGRGQEVPGEDPFLTGQYAEQYIRGIQFGEDTRYLKMSNTVKHYADYDLEGGRYGVPNRQEFAGNVTDQDQVEWYWPAWRNAINTANPRSMMCSYPSINSFPECGNDFFMNEIARNEWGFEGFIISDEGAIGDDSFTRYLNEIKTSNQDIELLRCQVAIEGGCDANIGFQYLNYLHDAVSNNYVSESDLDQAVSRWMTLTIELGLLDIPGPYYNNYDESYVDSPQNRELALHAAKQGMVLLKNDGGFLPLTKDVSKKYAFIGPHANATQYMLSSYVGSNTLVNSHSPYQIGKSQEFAMNITYEMGCKDLGCTDTSGFGNAVNAAKNADYVFVFLGLEPLNFAQSNDNYNTAVEAENFDRENVTFPGNQLLLLQQVSAANSKTILVLFNGSPLDVSWIRGASGGNVPAMIESFYPGELGGDAVLSMIFGEYSPAAKLPYTIYPSSICDDRAITDMSLRSNGGITYRYYTGNAVYPFGYGLSYTTFDYKYFNDSNAISHKTSFETIPFTIQVTNTGAMDSDCVVLGFVDSPQDPDAPITKLFDFQRVFVAKGQSKNVTLSISPLTISITNEYGVEQVKSGNYQIQIGDPKTDKDFSVNLDLNLYGDNVVLFDLPKLKQKYKDKLNL